MLTMIEIDLNVRVRGNGTYAGFEDVTGSLSVGEQVEVFESESSLVGVGRVTEIDPVRQLVYLSVDWASLRPGVPVAPEPRPEVLQWPGVVLNMPPVVAFLATVSRLRPILGSRPEVLPPVRFLPHDAVESAAQERELMVTSR
jgi:hypothetical protein